ncbi:MAG TPA: type II and III secretion system protein family protein [Magnetospirillum sp.]|jgi:pilus assembly protein CpaC|nr:type II and III secretion system protein family protein [Magnetospirillum sp.]
MNIVTRTLVGFGVVLALAAGPWGKGFAPLSVSVAAAAETGSRIDLSTGTGEMIRLPRPALSVFVANPDVADVQVPSPNAIFLLGKKAGTTTLYAVDGHDHEILRRDVTVRHNIAEMTELLRQRFPAHSFTLASAPGSLMVGGTVDTAAQVAAVADTLAPYLAKEDRLINNVAIRTPTQVHLRVRIAEVSRDITQQFGVNWQALLTPGHFVTGIFNGRDFFDNDKNLFVIPPTGWGVNAGFVTKNYNIQSVIDVLDQEGLVTVMAEPNLTAVSGQTASFLVGGEFPIPVVQSQSNSISVEFKPFGVALDFTPTVLSSDRISLLVRPEVSELSTANSIVVNNLVIPGLSVRRVETTVELASGQSFVLGGLLQDNMRDVVARLPGLGDLPILGHLFRSTDYRSNKSELVVIVTAYMVKPTDGSQLQTPLANLKPASDVEYINNQRLGTDPLAADTPRLVGPAGFVY